MSVTREEVRAELLEEIRLTNREIGMAMLAGKRSVYSADERRHMHCDVAKARLLLAALDDAERYQFIRSKLVSHSTSDGGIISARMTIGAAIGVDTPAAVGIPDALGWQLDANIDAARAGGEG